MLERLHGRVRALLLGDDLRGAGRPGLRALAYAALIALGSFAPFRFGYDGPRQLANGATFGPSGQLDIDGPAVVCTPGPPEWLAPAIGAESLRLSMRVRTARTDQRGPARIVTLSDGPLRRNFMVSQKGPDLLVRARRPNSDDNGAAPLKVDGVFAEAAWRAIEVEFARDAVNVFVDGKRRMHETFATSVFERWDPTYRFAVGDEVDGARGWEGALESLTLVVGDRVWAPLETPRAFDVPETIWDVPERTRMLWRIDPGHLAPVSIAHVLVFAPLGALLWLARRRRTEAPSAVAIGILCGLFGALLQVGKLAFLTRHPSLAHALPDGLGALFGALWAARATR